MLTDIAVGFELGARDVLLVYFFTTIGINASLKDLLAGGKPLLILLAITITYMFLQNLTGITVASLFDQPAAMGMLSGTVSLIGWHGTAIAWSPRLAEDYGVANAMKICIACATFWLILASLMGGPIARFLITRHKPTPAKAEPLDVGMSHEQKGKRGIGHLDLLDAILAIHICVILGFFINARLEELGLALSIFVTCLFAGILITNLIPKSFPKITGTTWPTRKPAMTLIADVSLGIFLVMSLISMQLWTLVELAGPIFTILGARFLIAVAVTVLVVFPVWCAVINLGLLIWWFLFITLAHNWTWRLHDNLFGITRDRFNAIHYDGMGLYKLPIFFFNIVPWFSLRIVVQAASARKFGLTGMLSPPESCRISHFAPAFPHGGSSSVF